MMQEGRIHPRVATIAPGTPAIFKPTEVAELTASQMHLYLALLFRRDYFARPAACWILRAEDGDSIGGEALAGSVLRWAET